MSLHPRVRRSLALLVPVLAGLARAPAARAAAEDPRATPVRIDVECEGGWRTRACPAFLAGFVD
ncbi:MAG: hypothetical protein K8W52_29955, partial [Deltaproteobacteria bacterium]|nr:hypothetical protein [Deltaproteobacteria bacterium]